MKTLRFCFGGGREVQCSKREFGHCVLFGADLIPRAHLATGDEKFLLCILFSGCQTLEHNDL